VERNRMRDDDRSTRRGRDEEDTPRRSRSRDEEEETPRRSRSRDEEESPRRSRGRDDTEETRGSRRGGSDFVYEQRSREQMQKRQSQGANDFDKYLSDGIKMFKPADGDNTIRILPPTWSKPEHFGYDIHVHYGIGPDQQTYLCLRKMKGEDCPICEELDLVKKEGGDEEAEKELRPNKRVLYYLIDREHEKEGVQVWPAPWTVDRDLVGVSQDKKSGAALPIDSPTDGFDITFTKTGAGMKTKYTSIAVDRRESELGKQSWLDAAVDMPLPETLKFYDYDHIAKAFGGGGSVKTKRDHDEDERERNRDDDRPKRSHSRDNEDDAPARSRSREPERKKEDDYTWESVHEMTGRELEDLIEVEKLPIDPDKAKDDEDLASWICEEMQLKKKPARVERDDREEGRSKLADMRNKRAERD
jgi:hypothetical protein